MISLDGFGRLRQPPERFDFDYHPDGRAAKPVFRISDIRDRRQMAAWSAGISQESFANCGPMPKPEINDLPK